MKEKKTVKGQRQQFYGKQFSTEFRSILFLFPARSFIRNSFIYTTAASLQCCKVYGIAKYNYQYS